MCLYFDTPSIVVLVEKLLINVYLPDRSTVLQDIESRFQARQGVLAFSNNLSVRRIHCVGVVVRVAGH